MRRLAAIAFTLATLSACGVRDLLRQYEYEEDVYLSLDGKATVYVNSSVPALDALRGAALDTNPKKLPDRAMVRDFFAAPFTHDIRVTTSRRSGRRFVHIRLDVDDVRAMSHAAAFSWSSYSLDRDGGLFVFQQKIGRAVGKDVGDVGWTGSEVVAFRLHLPSKIEYHNAGPSNPRRGNILVWEQSLADRLRGQPLTLDARMQTESILYRTLFLFGATLLAVAATFALVVWWIRTRGVPSAAIPEEADSGSVGVGRRSAAR